MLRNPEDPGDGWTTGISDKDEDLLRIFALRLPEYAFLILVGDRLQLAPPMIVCPKESVFAKESHLPMHLRLQILGFPYARLYQQARMAPQIAGIVGGLVYDRQMKNKKHVRPQYRGAQKAFKAWTFGKWRIESLTVVFLDHEKGALNDVVSKRGGSKYNDLFAVNAINMAVELLKICPVNRKKSRPSKLHRSTTLRSNFETFNPAITDTLALDRINPGHEALDDSHLVRVPT